MALKRFGVSLDEQLLQSLDQFVTEFGFANRSQAIRFLVEKNIAEKKWKCNNIVAGTVVLMFENEKKEIVTLIDDIQEEYQDIVLSSSHYYLNSDIHLVVVTIKGKAVRLTEFSDKLIIIKGIKHGKLAMSRAE